MKDFNIGDYVEITRGFKKGWKGVITDKSKSIIDGSSTIFSVKITPSEEFSLFGFYEESLRILKPKSKFLDSPYS